MARLGVGKSGGCRNCRRRKVKCDERIPGCERCEKAGQGCEGYARDHRFVDENERTERHAKKKASTTPPSDLKTSNDIVAYSASSSGSMGSNLGLRGFEDNVFVSFLLSNLFDGMPVTTPWLHLHAEDELSNSAQLSVRALSTLFFGRTHHHRAIPARGFDLYGQALVSLKQDLQTPKKGWSISVVKSAMALELYEFVAFSSTSGWIKHAGGLGRLFEIRGPYRHQFGEAKEIFEASRAIVALGHLVSRKRCFLDSHEWKTLPWALEPGSKHMNLYLHDILCDLPGLTESADILTSSRMRPEDVDARRAQLLERLASSVRELYDWRVSWQQQNPNACWEVPSKDTANNTNPFPIVFEYPSLVEANAITLYNALLLLLIRLGYQIIGPSFNLSSYLLRLPQNINYSPLIPPGQAPNPQALAIEICKGVEYHLCTERRRAGAFFLMFPLRVAWQALDPRDKVAKWIQDIMVLMADSTGFEVSRGLAGRNFEDVG